MSGVKDAIVNLRQSEYNRIMNSCRRADNIEAGISKRLEKTSSHLRQQMDSQIGQMQQRHNQFESALSNMSGEVRRIEKKNQDNLRRIAKDFNNGINQLDKKIKQQQREYMQKFAEHDKHLAAHDRILEQHAQAIREQRHEYITLIQQQGEHFAQALDEQRRELQGQIQTIQDHIVAKEQHAQGQARQWLQDTQALLKVIDESYDHQKFKPGELAKLQNELQIAENNISQGHYEAAISTTQRTYLHTQELRLELERLTLEWNAYLTAARQSAAEVLAACDTHQTAKFTFDSEEVAAEVDFWTHGALSKLRQQVAEEQNKLDKPDNLSLDELKQSIAHSEQWRQESEALVEQAKEALIASQLRNNIAQSIEAALEDAGWDVVDSTYEGEDHRGALHLKLQNLATDELVTIITPEKAPDQTIRNHLNIQFFDKNNNDEAYRQERLNRIMEKLRDEELDCSQPQCAPGTENQPAREVERLDFEKVRAKAVTA
ncbi:hypothetical protein PN36_06760 [Candidatus Thiomargarita nelsonii]|uniref:Uncharacterized protein n=1 Tax=Candidatus Thiomargarita nelsonii TaxID=1003181 RepID=A0A0A6S342_9GAMM|nr:hypothetical protein PN36_06760 [Candidatus Thiomargarita nelsonii]